MTATQISPGVWRHGRTLFIAYGQEPAERAAAMLCALTTGDPDNAAPVIVSLEHRLRDLDRLARLRVMAAGCTEARATRAPGRPAIRSAGHLRPVNRTAARVIGGPP